MSNEAKTVRIGIIGSGGIARSHVRGYNTMPEVEIVAVADVIPGKAAEFIQATGLAKATAYDDYRQLLEQDLDGVSICTPNVAHHRTSVDALLAGKHVLVEKPMAVTLEQAVDMVQASRKADKMLSIGFQPRYDPNMHVVKEIVQSGQLGKVYYVQTGGGRRRGIPGPSFVSAELAGAGAIADIGCYSLDMALNALDYPKPLTVSAVTTNHFGTNPEYYKFADRFDVDDFGVAIIRFENDLVLNFVISWAMHMDTLGATMFLGTKAGLKATPANGGVWDGRLGSLTLFHDILGHHTESPIPIKNHNINIFDEKVRDFVNAIRENKPAPIPGEQILRNQAIIDGIIRSAQSKREVQIELPE